MKVLVISDTQAPFQHKDALKFLKALKAKLRPDRVVHIGDEIDYYAISRFDPDPSHVENPLVELQRALDEFMYPLYAAFPKCDVMNSNHKDRIVSRAKRGGLPKEWLKSYEEIIEAPPGWKWRDSLVLDGVRYEHGHALSGSSHTVAYRAALMSRRSIVFGHFHSSPGFTYINGAEGEIFGFNVGCLMDRKAYAAAYFQGPKWSSLGTGVVIDGIPKYVPMKLNKSGTRWNGKIHL